MTTNQNQTSAHAISLKADYAPSKAEYTNLLELQAAAEALPNLSRSVLIALADTLTTGESGYSCTEAHELCQTSGVKRAQMGGCIAALVKAGLVTVDHYQSFGEPKHEFLNIDTWYNSDSQYDLSWLQAAVRGQLPATLEQALAGGSFPIAGGCLTGDCEHEAHTGHEAAEAAVAKAEAQPEPTPVDDAWKHLDAATKAMREAEAMLDKAYRALRDGMWMYSPDEASGTKSLALESGWNATLSMQAQLRLLSGQQMDYLRATLRPVHHVCRK